MRHAQTILLLGLCGGIMLGLGLTAYLILSAVVASLALISGAWHRGWTLVRDSAASVGMGVVWPVLLIALVVHAISATRVRAAVPESVDGAGLQDLSAPH